MSAAILSFKSHTAGKNADVTIYEDRIEWVQKRSINWVLAFCTAGMSLLTLLLPGRNAGTEMIPIKRVSSVTTSRQNVFFTSVKIYAGGNTIDFVVTHDEATHIRNFLNNLILAQ